MILAVKNGTDTEGVVDGRDSCKGMIKRARKDHYMNPMKKGHII